MPQGRRKVPFSGKKKKEQLAVKRQRKGAQNYLTKTDSDSDDSQDGASPSGTQVQKINAPKGKNTRQSRYALQFFKETNKDLVLMKHKARDPLVYVESKEREIGELYFENYDFPTRQPWNYNMSKEELDRNENRYFTQYVKALEEQHNNEEKVVSLFELNLETWRQLWRVLEISDIVLIIVDIRYPTLMFPPSLFAYITTVLNKDVILILNKIDLVRSEVVVAWKQYFLEKYPRISLSLFASYRAVKATNMKVTKKRPNQKNNGESVLDLFKCVKNIVGSDLDLSKWEDKIREDIAQNDLDMDDDSSTPQVITKSETYEMEDHVKYKNGILTIGCVGFPNVGKSSIINTLKGRKVVSVSRTPGHTKYFQTIFLTENVRLCDCPGLVFPSSTPKPLQVILGSYPIAQLREPYASIRFVGERINLPDILTIQLPEDYPEWSPVALCEAWALKKGFLTAKAARPDTNRAANNILQLVLQGRIVLEFFPPEFTGNEDKWRNHPDIQEVQKIQNKDLDTEEESIQECSSHSENEENKSESSDDEDSEGDTTTTTRKGANAFSLLDDD